MEGRNNKIARRREWSTKTFLKCVDSVDIDSDKFDSNPSVIVGLSSLEGNTWDGGVVEIDAQSGDEVASLALPVGVPAVRYALDKRNVIVARDDGIVSLCSKGNLSELHRFDLHDDAVTMVTQPVTTSQEHCFISVGFDGCIHVTNLETNQTNTSKLGAHYSHINDVAASQASSNTFSTVGDDGFLRNWDVRKEESCGICDVQERASSVLSLTESLVMVGTDGGNIVQLDVRNMSEPVCQVAAHKGRVRRISRPIGGHDVIPRAVFTASDDCTVRKLDFSQGGTFTSKVITELQHQDYVADVACMHANDDTKEYLRLLTGSTDKTITITDMF